MVGRGDDDGVEFLLEKFAVVGVRGGRALRAFFDGVAARGVDVADGSDLVVAGLVGGVEQVVHAAASADDSNAERVVGAKDACGCQSGQPGTDDESAAIKLVCHGEHVSGSGRTREARKTGTALRVPYTWECRFEERSNG